MQTGVIIRRKAGMLLPVKFLTAAVEANPKGYGAAIVADGKIMIDRGESPSIEMITETIKDFEKNDITFFLANSDAAINIDDLSPYSIFEKDGNPELIAFITGKFPSHEQGGSSHPAEFFIANKYLIPRLQSFYELTDGNIPKIMEQIKKPVFKDDLLSNAVDNGHVTFVANNGDAVTFSKGDTSAEFPWGWTSNHYGFSEVPKQETPQQPQKKGMFGKSTVREKAQVPPSPSVAGSKAIEPPKTEAAIIKRYELIKWAPQKTLSRQDRKKAYKSRIGYCPKGWEDCVQVDVYKDNESGKLLTASEVKSLGLAALGLPQTNNPEKVRDTEVEHIPQPAVQPQQKKVETSLIPIMSPPTREHIKKIMADPKVQKLIDENAAIIHDPTKLKQLEERFKDFSAQLGLTSIDTFMSWSYEMMFDLAREKPDGAACLMWTFRNMLAAKMAKDKKETVSEPAVEEVEAQPPVRKGMFGQRKAG